MKYVNALVVFPRKLVEELQKYVHGTYVYIPQKDGKRRVWGELTGGRAEIEKRNSRIKKDYSCGVPIVELAEKYFLSEHTIKKIVG